MIGVPAVWESIREGIIAKINSGIEESSHESHFERCYYVLLHIPVLAQLADALILSKARAALEADCVLH